MSLEDLFLFIGLFPKLNHPMMGRQSTYRELKPQLLLEQLIIKTKKIKDLFSLHFSPALMNLMMLYKFTIDKESLKTEFYYEEWLFVY